MGCLFASIGAIYSDRLAVIRNPCFIHYADCWRENPATLLPFILSNVKNFAPDESKQKFAQGHQEALEKAEELCEQLAQLPDSQQKVAEAKHNIVQKDIWKSYNPVYA